MRLCNAIPARLLTMNKSKQYNTLSVNDLGGGIARQVIHLTYFDFTQYKYSHTICADANQGHLMYVLCPCRTRPSGMLSRQSPLRLG